MINFNITIHRWHVVAIIAAMILLKGGSLAYAAWSGPTAAPPGNNASAPINVGSGDQVKNGGLSINALAVFGNAIVSGSYLNFGSTAGSAGVGIRNNNGILEFKNSGGNWVPMATSTSSSAPTSQPLQNGVHTTGDCQNAGGVPRTVSGTSLCEMSGGSCPSGWTRSASWGSTHPNSCTGVTSCSTGSHAFANAGIETCSYCTRYYYTSCSMTATCSASQATVGCY